MKLVVSTIGPLILALGLSQASADEAVPQTGILSIVHEVRATFKPIQMGQIPPSEKPLLAREQVVQRIKELTDLFIEIDGLAVEINNLVGHPPQPNNDNALVPDNQSLNERQSVELNLDQISELDDASIVKLSELLEQSSLKLLDLLTISASSLSKQTEMQDDLGESKAKFVKASEEIKSKRSRCKNINCTAKNSKKLIKLYWEVYQTKQEILSTTEMIILLLGVQLEEVKPHEAPRFIFPPAINHSDGKFPET